jgi:hypothetical protein
MAAVAAITKPEPALLPPPTQPIPEDDANTDVPITTAAAPATGGSSVHITLLLTTGARHPFTIDHKYLKRRNVGAAGAEVDPFEISVYTMKELIWKDWREGSLKYFLGWCGSPNVDDKLTSGCDRMGIKTDESRLDTFDSFWQAFG